MGEKMKRDVKHWRWYVLGWSFIFLCAQFPGASVDAKELSGDAKKILENPSGNVTPSVQQELIVAWKQATKPILEDFLPGLGHKFSFRVKKQTIDDKPYLYFSATGKKRGAGKSPALKVTLEIFHKGGDAPLEHKYGLWFLPLDMGPEKIVRKDFSADRAAFSTMMGEGIEAFYWQKGEAYVEVQSEKNVQSVAEKLNSELKEKQFYDILSFLNKTEGSSLPPVVASVTPAPAEPESAPVEPEPTPAEPESAPVEPDPTPVEPEPAPEDPITIVTPFAAPPSKSKLSQWVYKGCYKDNGRRDLSGFQISEPDMTIEKCVQHCSSRNFSVAGTQFGTWCFCGNDFGQYGQADNCNMNCAGNSYQICGGGWANSIYASNSTSTTKTPPAIFESDDSKLLLPKEKIKGLYAAAKKGDLQKVKELIAIGADLEDPGKDNETPIIAATDNGNAEVVEALIAAGANLDVKVEYDFPLLGIAVDNGYDQIVKLLVEAGAKIEFKDDKGATFLAAATYGNHVEVLRYLIRQGADVNSTKLYRKDKVLDGTPLMVAAEAGKIVPTLILLQAGTDPNYQGDKGNSALMLAIERGKKEVVAALLAAGADPKAKNAEGKSVLEIARDRDKSKIIKMIEGVLGIPSKKETEPLAKPNAKVAPFVDTRWIGEYTSTHGKKMTFQPEPYTDVIGRYQSDNGRIVGKVVGRKLDGYWVERWTKKKCKTQKDNSYYWGWFRVTFNEDFSAYSGTWAYCEDSKTGGKWEGKKLSSAIGSKPSTKTTKLPVEPEEKIMRPPPLPEKKVSPLINKPWTGEWTSTYGKKITFQPEPETEIIGRYNSDNGRIVGIVIGHSLNGFWVENSSNKKCKTKKDNSYYWGWFRVTFNPDYTTYSGNWAYCNDVKKRGKWEGKRLGMINK